VKFFQRDEEIATYLEAQRGGCPGRRGKSARAEPPNRRPLSWPANPRRIPQLQNPRSPNCGVEVFPA
jgi:hypothetical protein